MKDEDIKESCLSSSAPKLPPQVSYYIRRLLRQNIDFLQSAVKPDKEITVNSFKNLDFVIEKLYPDASKLADVIAKLESLMEDHISLVNQDIHGLKELQKCECQIYTLLGLRHLSETEHRQKKILIVDDSTETLELLGRSLKEKGYSIYATVNNQNVTVIANAYLPDLILLDVVMPGKSGYEVCQQLKAQEKFRNIPIIFISSSKGSAHREKSMAVGSIACITKPFDVKNVMQIIRSYLNQAIE